MAKKNKQKYYAVKKGLSHGIFLSWEECQKQINGYSGAVFQAFPTMEEAVSYLTSKADSPKEEQSNAPDDADKIKEVFRTSFSEPKKKKKKEPALTYEQLNADQKNAYDIMELGENVFLSGEAGTGKSFLINCFLQNHKNKNIIVCAPTGIAALQVHGTTVHRLFQVKPGPVGPNEPLKKLDDRILAADIIVMDEVSMCRFDLFSVVCRYIEKAERQSRKKIQFIVVGDFHQLPPVIAPAEKPFLKTIWEERIDTENLTGYAFESPQWAKMDFQNIVLTEIMRQSGSSEFVKYLNLIRKGDQEGVKWINEHAAPDEQPGVFLFGKNASADEKNSEEVRKINEKMIMYRAAVSGDFKEKDFPTNAELKLCKGARVMALINDPSRVYQNGSLGTVFSLSDNKVTVEFDNGKTADIEPYEWQATDYDTEYDRDEDRVMIVEKTIGTFTQIPLRIAFAITIHKSQGQTYDSVNLDPACFSAGQLYVALSRVVDIDHLHLLKPIRPRDLITDQKVLEFYRCDKVYIS